MAQRPAALPFFALFMRYWLPVLAYVTAILVVSAQPYLQPPVRLDNVDKIAHFVEYLGLGLLLGRAIRAALRVRVPLHASLMAISLGIIVGASDEIFQSFVAGRDSSLHDLLADATGLVFAQIVYLFAVRD